jgi:RNase P subunit RPR2
VGAECDWQSSHDGYGTSWICKACGKHVFYQEEKPQGCLKDQREPYEAAVRQQSRIP